MSDENLVVDQGEVEGAEEVALYQPVLGLYPYILIQATPDENGTASVELQAGGFPDGTSREAVIELLESITEDLRGRDA